MTNSNKNHLQSYSKQCSIIISQNYASKWLKLFSDMRKKAIKFIIEFMFLVAINVSDRQTFKKNVNQHQDVEDSNIAYSKNLNVF